MRTPISARIRARCQDRLHPQAKAVSATGEQALAVDKSARGFVVIGKIEEGDSTPGKFGEEAYDTASHVTTLTVTQRQGLDPLPTPPPPSRTEV